MKQVIIRNGKAVVEEVPPPALAKGYLLVRNTYSVISTGTEIVSKKSVATKVFFDRERILKGLQFLKQKGLKSTYQFVKGMFDFGVEVGYSSSGEVVAVGEAVKDFAVGDFVACAGASFAHHAEYIVVPENLAVKVPQNVPLRDAASTTIGAIALQGIRQANLKIGESCAVVGLGLLGQLGVQMLKASGVTVMGIDINPERVELAKSFGANEGFLADDPDITKKILMRTSGHGVDSTILYAGTQSSAPLNYAMEYTRKRGVVVVVGAIGLNLSRSPWYEKEIELKISTSYGPGRYDTQYEINGVDYPYPYVRWTEKRNMEAYLGFLKDKKVLFEPLIENEFLLDDAPCAYDILDEKPLAVVFNYDKSKKENPSIKISLSRRTKNTKLSIGVIGLGSFAQGVHLPNLEKLHTEYDIRAVCSKNGVKAKQIGMQYKAVYATTDFNQVVIDPEIDAVFIATRHATHAELTIRALEAGKHVFVEKPLAINREELQKIKEVFLKNNKVLMVGYNRRFSPSITELKKRFFERVHPLMIYYRMNAGFLPSTHWAQGEEGGGRIVGEVCHILDVLSYLVDCPVKKCTTSYLKPNSYYSSHDNISVTLEFEDGSLGNILYTALGNTSAPKEYCEVFCDGKMYILDDYYTIKSYGDSLSLKTHIQNKGHLEELKMFVQCIKSGEMPISWESLEMVSELSFQIHDALKKI